MTDFATAKQIAVVSPTSLTRSYDSHGPDVRIRGTALHVAERYLQLARDANTASNPVAAENYLQHAEHYFRLIAAAQAEQLQAQNGDVRATGDSGPEDLDDERRFRWPARSFRLSGAASAASLHQPNQCRLRRLLRNRMGNDSPGFGARSRHLIGGHEGRSHRYRRDLLTACTSGERLLGRPEDLAMTSDGRRDCRKEEIARRRV